MVLASARLRGIHPPDNIQNGGCPGGECLSNAHWLGPWRQHFDDESWRGRVTRVGLLCTLFCAMVLASACLRGIHPPDIIQNGERPGGDAS